MNLDEYLKVVGDYADQIAQADRQADKRSMDVAARMDAMYWAGIDKDGNPVPGGWADEWLAQKPKPKRPTPKWDPVDRNRFIAWQAWKLEQAQRSTLKRVYSWQLLDAAETCKICCPATDLATERAWRPLRWMKRYGYAADAPKVWAAAVDLAGGDPSRVTAKHTSEALAQWKRAKFGKRNDGTDRSSQNAVDQVATAKAKARLIRQEVLRDFDAMWNLSALDPSASDEINGLLEDITAWVAAHPATKDAA